MKNQTMTIDEVAEFFKVRRETIYLWMREPDFPKAFKKNRTIRFRRPDIEDFWASHSLSLEEEELDRLAQGMG